MTESEIRESNYHFREVWQLYARRSPAGDAFDQDGVSFEILITVLSLTEPLTGDGETITVNRYAALISSSVPLRIEMKIRIQVVLTGKVVMRSQCMLIPSGLHRNLPNL